MLCTLVNKEKIREHKKNQENTGSENEDDDQV